MAQYKIYIEIAPLLGAAAVGAAKVGGLAAKAGLAAAKTAGTAAIRGAGALAKGASNVAGQAGRAVAGAAKGAVNAVTNAAKNINPAQLAQGVGVSNELPKFSNPISNLQNNLTQNQNGQVIVLGGKKYLIQQLN